MNCWDIPGSSWVWTRKMDYLAIKRSFSVAVSVKFLDAC